MRRVVVLTISVIMILAGIGCRKYISSLSKPQLTGADGERIISITTGDNAVTIVTDRDTYYLTSDMEHGPLEYMQTSISVDSRGSNVEGVGRIGSNANVSGAGNITSGGFNDDFSGDSSDVSCDDVLNGFSIDNGYETMFFTNETPDGSYMFMTPYGKLSELQPAECVIFNDCPSLLSGRGYIWGRTIPLLRRTLLIGTGPDTFLLSFPHYDYVEALINNYIYQLVNKPHSFYLQIAVQTGVISLICILLIMISQIVSGAKAFLYSTCISDAANANITPFTESVSSKDSKVYNHSEMESTYSKKAFRFIILVCSIGLCLSGLLNDSNLSVMPYVILIFSAL